VNYSSTEYTLPVALCDTFFSKPMRKVKKQLHGFSSVKFSFFLSNDLNTLITTVCRRSSIAFASVLCFIGGFASMP
jgi:hypothetical protein